MPLASIVVGYRSWRPIVMIIALSHICKYKNIIVATYYYSLCLWLIARHAITSTNVNLFCLVFSFDCMDSCNGLCWTGNISWTNDGTQITNDWIKYNNIPCRRVFNYPVIFSKPRYYNRYSKSITGTCTFTNQWNKHLQSYMWWSNTNVTRWSHTRIWLRATETIFFLISPFLFFSITKRWVR